MTSPEALLDAIVAIQEDGPEVRFEWVSYFRIGNTIDTPTLLSKKAWLRKHWKVLEDYTVENDGMHEEVLRLGEERSWSMGNLGMHKLCTKLWPRLSAKAKAHYLAGASDLDEYPLLKEDLLPDYSDTEVEWDAWSFATFVCHAIYLARQDRFFRAMNLRDLKSMTLPQRNYFGDQMWLQQYIPNEVAVMDKFLEWALRSRNGPVFRYCLQHGANPNLVIWHKHQWYSALFYLSLPIMERHASHAPKGYNLRTMLLEFHPNPEGHPVEGRNRPLHHAWTCKRWERVDELLDLGASFEGGHFATHPPTEEQKRAYFPGTHVDESPIPGRWRLPELWTEVNKLVPLVPWYEVPWYRIYGRYTDSFYNFMGWLLDWDEPEPIVKYASRGLPMVLTLPDIIRAARRRSEHVLPHVLTHLGVNARNTLPELRQLVKTLAPG